MWLDCVDCGAPNPQWATIPYAVFICLSCAGLHRGLGVHISFVRSITMDEWTEEQMKKMRIGGNLRFTTFMKEYTPTDQGGYREGMTIAEKYNTWAAAQYKEKLSVEVQGQEWSPSAPPPNFGQPISRPSSAQGVRKTRASGRNNTASPLRRDSASPSPNNAAAGDTSTPSSLTDAAYERKTANDQYFSSLGEINARRREDLPPSQGGKYQGFGNTPMPAASSSHPSWGTSSAAAPTLEEFQTQPVAALSKGWTLLSAAVTAASKIVVDKAMDPSLHDNVKSYAASAGKMAVDTGRSANEWSKRELGVDVADKVTLVTDKAKGALGMSNHPGGGYSAVGGPQTGFGTWHDDDAHGTRLYAEGGDEDEEDFFERQLDRDRRPQREHQTEVSSPAPTTPGTANSSAPLNKGKKGDEWDKDEWAEW
ncbi:Zn finger-containing GTPase- Activating Protein for ARF [Serendipita sp. 399]|nr:Zn finger-containing GTPase- Activating Protein for ARF [Serendipita sp. 399]